MSDIYFSNYQLQDNIHYFLYIGELKNYGLNIFLKESLSRIENRQIDFISIVPDIFEQYDYENLVRDMAGLSHDRLSSVLGRLMDPLGSSGSTLPL